MWDQSPEHVGNLPNRFLRMLPDDGDWLRGHDDVARTPIVIRMGSVEVFLDDFFS
jgi:hypothetical protein